jgi:hypothetical protein
MWCILEPPPAHESVGLTKKVFDGWVFAANRWKVTLRSSVDRENGNLQ